MEGTNKRNGKGFVEGIVVKVLKELIEEFI